VRSVIFRKIPVLLAPGFFLLAVFLDLLDQELIWKVFLSGVTYLSTIFVDK